MNVGELKEWLQSMPDDMPVELADPNFGGSLEAAEFEDGRKGFTEEYAVLIKLPIISSVD